MILMIPFEDNFPFQLIVFYTIRSTLINMWSHFWQYQRNWLPSLQSRHWDRNLKQMPDYHHYYLTYYMYIIANNEHNDFTVLTHSRREKVGVWLQYYGMYSNQPHHEYNEVWVISPQLVSLNWVSRLAYGTTPSEQVRSQVFRQFPGQSGYIFK